MINSNFTDRNGLQITEGAKVYWTSQDRYQSSGTFIVDSLEGETADIRRLDGSCPNYHYADVSELAVQVR